MAGVSAEIRIEDFPKSSLELYPCQNPFGGIINCGDTIVFRITGEDYSLKKIQVYRGPKSSPFLVV
jgi:hypothetical protein